MRAAGKTIQPSCGAAEELGYYRLLVVDRNGERTARVFFFHVQGPASPRTSRRARLTGRFANLGGTRRENARLNLFMAEVPISKPPTKCIATIGCFHPRRRSLTANHEVRFIGQLTSGAVVRAVDSFGRSAVRCDSACRAGVGGIATPKSFEDKLAKMLTALCLLGREGTRPFGDDPLQDR